MSLGGKVEKRISEIDNVEIRQRRNWTMSKLDNVGNSQHKQMTISILIHAIFWRTNETIFSHKQILISI